jgi:MFS family permease
MLPKDSSYPVGVYGVTPIVGRIVDAKGPRYVFVAACLLLLVGYSVIRFIYDRGAQPSGSISTFTFGLLVFSSFMTGVGGSGGLTSSINATVKSFPERAVSQNVFLIFVLVFIVYNIQRATTTGIVLSGFGLSAFFFSALSHTIFRGNTSSFLLLLALGTSFPMIIGFFLVRSISLPAYEARNSAEYTIVNEAGPIVDLGSSASVIPHHEHDSHTPLLASTDEDPSLFIHHDHGESPVRTSLELSPTRSSSPGMRSTKQSRSHAPRPSLGSTARMLDMPPNISGRQLWMSSDFLLFFTIMSLCKSFS